MTVMLNWRETVIKTFIPDLVRLFLVADPDQILSDESIIKQLQAQGFDLLTYEDPIEFRYIYENQYRCRWDAGEKQELIVVLNAAESELANLPYDLLQNAQKVSFQLSELFPSLSYPVLQSLEKRHLDALFQALSAQKNMRLSEQDSKDFILRHVYEIVPADIQDPRSLLKCLLRLHYNQLKMPTMILENMISQLKKQMMFLEWPLALLFQDEADFYAFLQERWPVFLKTKLNTLSVSETASEYGLKYAGPALLPFDHEDIRVYIDSLFLEGKLAPVSLPQPILGTQPPKSQPIAPWIQIGILANSPQEKQAHLLKRLEFLEKECPRPEARHTDWINFAFKWAEASAEYYQAQMTLSEFKQAGLQFNRNFANWLTTAYAGLINISPSQPAMLHQLARNMARVRELNQQKLALIVVDGLALDQWITLRQLLQAEYHDYQIQESAVFAWIPTVTSVSRQAIFAGKAPSFFPTTIQRTDSEEKFWKNFWEENGLNRYEVIYQKGLGNTDMVFELDEHIDIQQTQVLGLVIDTVDKIMHGMELGAAGMHNQIKQWYHQGYFKKLIDYLVQNHFQIWLTSDHGNVECLGQGLVAEGAIADLKGERVRVYPSPELRDKMAQQYPFARLWKPIGLPENYFPLIAQQYDAFVRPGTVLVGHGGISMEEVIVPWIRITGGKNESTT